MKKILGLDLGTNSIGWALVDHNFDKKEGSILGMGSRIIPMSQDILGKFDSGVTVSQTSERTNYRGIRRLYQRDNQRRERLHRTLNILNFLPKHYADSIDFENKLGQFKSNTEVKLPYKKDENGKHIFIFQESFSEMVNLFKEKGFQENIPYDWTIYYLRKKALTRKIQKEELSWILLNFNQKRGYYQLRGEETEEQENKREEYFELTVKRVEETEEKNDKGTWYNIVLENDWIYRRQSKDSLADWKDKTREFIVTTTIDTKGNEKRSFRAVDSEKDWIAIKKKTENELKLSGETVGSYIFETLLKNPKQKIRGKLIKTIERNFYRNELEAILKTQIKEHPELQNPSLLFDCINELYPNNKAHKTNLKDKGFAHLFLNDIILYQRPLKSKKSTVGSCQFEHQIYFKDGQKVKKPLKAAPKSNPLFQEFRLWQFIHNLKIYEREALVNEKTEINHDITVLFLKNHSDYSNLFDYLNGKIEIDQKGLLRYFNLDQEKYRWNYVEEKKYPCNETRAEFLKKLIKIKNIDIPKVLTKNFELQLWHIVYSVKDKKEYEKALKTFAKKNEIDENEFFDSFKAVKPYESAYGSFSIKALKKLLPLMRRGKYWEESAISIDAKQTIKNILDRIQSPDFEIERMESFADDEFPKQLLKSFIGVNTPLEGLNTYQASYAIYKRHSESGEVKYWKSLDDINRFLSEFKQHSLRNPIVEQVVTETLRLVRDVWTFYGKGNENFFNEIHVELGREMKNDKKTRELLSKMISENENTNERIRNILIELMNDPDIDEEIRPYSKGHQDILKLYEEGVYSNSGENYKGVTIEYINKIRKNNSPTKAEINKYKLWLQQGYVSPYTGRMIPLSKLFSTEYQIEHIIPQSRYFDDSLSNKVICESAVNEEKDNQTAYEFIKNNPGRIIDLGKGEKVTILSIDAYESHCKTYFKGITAKLKLLLSEDIPEGFINRQLNDSRYISKVIKTLLSNIVREQNEQEVTSKNLVPVTGAITNQLKNDWGLDDVWEKLITPRFERLNKLTNSTDFRKEVEEFDGNKKTINTVPDALIKGFSKKRIDHRHHALDALVIALTSRNHVTYLGNLNANEYNKRYDLKTILCYKSKKDKNGNYRWVFKKPWENITTDTLEQLSKTVISFKKNQRIINKAINKTWHWEKVNGQLKKVLQNQKGINWAIRKPMHKDSVSGMVTIQKNGKEIRATAIRKRIDEKLTRKQLESITDTGIQKILENHLKNYIDDKGFERFDLAFNQDGLDEMNYNIKLLNNGKPHQPIKSARFYEEGNKFVIGTKGNKNKKFVEAAKGTNLFFNVYWHEKKQKRVFETVPLNEVIEHQKQVACLPKDQRTEVPINIKNGKFLFSLSPNDLVYVPTNEELENPKYFYPFSLNKNQINRIYKTVSASGSQCFFIKAEVAKTIWDKIEFASLNKMERDIEGNMIKEICWKLKIDRLGNVLKY